MKIAKIEITKENDDVEIIEMEIEDVDTCCITIRNPVTFKSLIWRTDTENLKELCKDVLDIISEFGEKE